MRLFLLLIPIFLLAKVVEIPGAYDYFEAQKACKKLGQNFRIMEIWELFGLRGDKRFGKGKLYWSGNTLGEARIEKNIRHESEIFVLDKDIPAYAFYLQDGDITPTPKSTKAHVLCTDAPKHHQLDQEFERLPSGAVVDRKSQILWEPFDPKRDRIKKSLEEAREYCENLKLFGLEWRLPDLEELFGIVNYNYTKPSVNKKIFGHMHHKYYLSDDEFGEDQVYVVGFAIGSVATAPKSERYHFRCVSDLDKEAASRLGIFDPASEIEELLHSKKSQKEKLEELLEILKRYEIDQATAAKVLHFLDEIKDPKLQKLKNEVKKSIRLISSGLA